MVVYHILAWAIALELITIIEAVNWGKYPLSYVLRSYLLVCIYLLYICLSPAVESRRFLC